MIVTIISAIMLLCCLFDDLPYSYFRILRLVVFGTCAYRLWLSWVSDNKLWIWFFVISGLLFNPVYPVYLNRGVWLIIDVGVAVAMLFSLIALRNNRTQDRKEPENTD